jgi:hypothetical protein
MSEGDPPARRVLLAAHISTHLTELSRVADLLAANGRFEPLLWIARPFDAWEARAAAFVERGVLCIGPNGEPIAAEPERAGAADQGSTPRPAWRVVVRRILEALPARLGHALVSLMLRARTELQIPAFALELKRGLRQIGAARRLLKRYRPRLVILAEDSVEYGTAALIRAGHEAGIASLIVPFTIVTAFEPAEAYFSSRAHQLRGFWNRVLARLSPRWVFAHRGRRLLRLPAGRAVAQEILGLAPPRPWALNSGAVDAIAVESQAMYRHYLGEGLPAAVLELTGSLADDVLARRLDDREGARRRLEAELSLPAGRPLVVCALPTDQLGSRRPECDFASYPELLGFVIGVLANLGECSCVGVLHPRASLPGNLTCGAPGVPIVRHDTASLVPLCDVFVASASATIRWALACGVPALDYDVYRYRYGDYAAAGGVVTVEGREEFRAGLLRLVEDVARGARVAARAREERTAWGFLDGQSGVRVTALLERLSAEGRREPGQSGA